MAVLSARVRWLVPVGVAAVVTAVGAGVTLTASAAPTLPPKSAAQLLVDLQRANLTPFSGTVAQYADLGLPALPNGGSTGLINLASGPNTVRVWYAGPLKIRLAVLGNLGESDVIRNGRDVWTWSSDANTYTHNILSGEPAKPEPPLRATTPQEAAQQALALLGTSTNVTTDGTAQVARRKAYELVLSPKDSRSLIGSVRIAVDAERSIPLRVQVFARGASKANFEVGFSQVSFQTPGDEQFAFSPPKGSTEDKNGGLPNLGKIDPDSADQRGAAVEKASKIVGHGWTAVAISPAPQADLGSSPLGAVVDRLPRVSGSWGSGRLFSGPLFSAVLTDDNRLAVGAVTPEALYQALGAR
jgi:outer membrane lipoprotein-sorting protein